MIELSDPRFWVLVLVLVGLVRSGLAPRWRPLVFFLATLYLFHTRPGWPIGACLLAVAGYGWVALATLRVGSQRQVALHVAVMAGLFVASQYATALVPGVAGIERIMPLIGLPYLFLRFVHLLVEVSSGRLERPTPLLYLAYLLPFHQILAGPIQRWPDFAAQVLQRPLPPLTSSELLSALSRITDGFLKKAVLAELLLEGVGFRFDRPGLWTWLEMDLFALWLFLDFSGYMDIVIGVGRLVGWTPPENFDWPYLSRNIVVFWTRWHITLSEWVRDYVFTPLNLTLQRGWLAGRPLTAGIVSYLVSMVTVGLWHRVNLQFALYGLLQGVGIGVFKIWETQLRKRLGKEGLKRYQASRPIQALATVVTFHYVAMTCIVAFHPPSRALAILLQLVGL